MNVAIIINIMLIGLYHPPSCNIIPGFIES
jgi:hypothetical protein